jgi:hypothetical protein
MVMHELTAIPLFELRIRQLTESLQGQMTFVSARIIASSCFNFIVIVFLCFG